MTELVSVFLPTFSRLYDGHLERTIQSVLNQTYPHFELLIVDDASVDGSKELIEHYVKQDSRIKHIRMENNVGLPAYTTGLGYLQSKGDYLAFAYDDCVLSPDHLAVLMNKLCTEPSLGMAYGQAVIHWNGGTKQTIGSPFNAEAMAAMNNHIPNVSVMVKRHVIESIGWYDSHFLLSRLYDWDLWFRISKHYPIGFVHIILAEEHGTRLADSIGNTYTLIPELILKYAKENRNQLLKPKPSALENYDRYRLVFQQQLTPIEMEQLKFLLLEHYFRTFNIGGILQLRSERDDGSSKWKKIVSKNRGVEDNSLRLMQVMLEYMEWKTAALIEKNNQSLHDKQNYINEQQKFIDHQQHYIDKMQK